MNKELAARYEDALLETIGRAGRLISMSKTLYREHHPENATVFNANVCLVGGKIWHGDIDLTIDEPLLLDLSRRTGQIVYVLYEGDGRFDHEDAPLIWDATYSVTPSGHSSFDHRIYERARDGTLRRRVPLPDTRRRWSWRVFWHRPRLFRFWVVRGQRSSIQANSGPYRRGALLYVGRCDGGRTPLLVIGVFTGPRAIAFEWTWYAARGEPQRSAPRALFTVTPRVAVRRLTVWTTLVCWPAFVWEVRVGLRLRRHW